MSNLFATVRLYLASEDYKTLTADVTVYHQARTLADSAITITPHTVRHDVGTGNLDDVWNEVAEIIQHHSDIHVE